MCIRDSASPRPRQPCLHQRPQGLLRFSPCAPPRCLLALHHPSHNRRACERCSSSVHAQPFSLSAVRRRPSLPARTPLLANPTSTSTQSPTSTLPSHGL